MLKGFILAVASACCYGMGPILFKLGFRAGLTEADILFSRFAMASVLVAGYMALTRPKRLRPSPRLIIVSGLTATCLYAMECHFFLSALEHIPAATTSLIFYFYPLTVTIISLAFLGMRMTRLTAASLVVILTGSVFVSLDALTRNLNMTGVLFALGAMLAFSVYMIVIQLVVKKEHPLTFTLYVLIWMSLIFAVLGRPQAFLEFDTRRAIICLLIGLIPTALAIPMLYMAIDLIGSAWTSIFSSFELVATLVAARFILGEEINIYQIAGMVLIIAGVALPNLRLEELRRALRQRRL